MNLSMACLTIAACALVFSPVSVIAVGRQATQIKACQKGDDSVNPNVFKTNKLPVPPPSLLNQAAAPRGVSVFKVCFDNRGRVAQVFTIKSSENQMVDDFIRRELRKWRVKPVIKQGRAMESQVSITFNFEILEPRKQLHVSPTGMTGSKPRATMRPAQSLES